jgi:hypothetical protein
MTHHVRVAALAALVLALPAVVGAHVVHCEAGDVSCVIAAISQANADPQRRTTIDLEAGVYALTAVNNLTDGPNGLPSIVSNVTIKGAKDGATILTRSGDAPTLRILHVGPSGQLALERITVSGGGDAFVDTNSPDGAGLFNNGGAVTASDSSFTNNQGDRGAIFSSNGVVRLFDATVAANRGATIGGLVASGGTLELTRTVIQNNSAGFFGGMVGGIQAAAAQVRITDSHFSGNGAPTTGALSVGGGTLTLRRSTFAGNNGNGVHALLLGTGTAAVIHDSAFVENGSALAGTTFVNSGTADVINTTFARNSIGDLFSLPKGIAITNFGTMTILNSTFAQNTVGVPFHGPASVIYAETGTVSLKNTILDRTLRPEVPLCDGQITSLGHNLFDETSSCNLLAVQSSDLIATADLAPLSDDGTPGNAHYPLLPSSSAIDAADSSACTKKDQIGRPRAPRCDVGAVESAPGNALNRL